MVKQIKNINFIYIALVLSGLLLAFITVSPVLNSGYTGDDSFESLTEGTILINHDTLAGYTYDKAKYFIIQYGRFDPLQFYYYTVYYLTDLHVYKTLVIISIIIDLLLFGYFIKLITKSPILGILSIIIMPAFFQQRLFHDPILGYHMLMQLILFISIISWIFLYNYLKKGKIIDLVISLIIFTISLSIYEVTYVFCLIPIAMVILYSENKDMIWKLKVSSFYAILSSIFISIPILIRVFNGISIVGSRESARYSLNLNASDYIQTLIRQTIAGFPLSYYAFDPYSTFDKTINAFIANLSITAFIICVGTITLSYVVLKVYLKEIKSENNIGSNKLFPYIGLFVIGILLLIIPGVLVSSSPEYQRYIIWGIGYLPVYLSYFGLGMIVIGIVWYIFKKFNVYNNKYMMAIVLIFAILISGINTLNYSNNVTTIQYSNLFWLYPRTVIEDAMHNGLFSHVPDSSTLILDTSYPWDQAAFYRMHSGLSLECLSAKRELIYVGGGRFNSSYLPSGTIINRSNNISMYKLSGSNDVFYISYDSYTENEGYAILSNVNYLEASNDTIYNVTGNDMYVYVRTPYDNRPNVHHQIARYVSINGYYMENMTGMNTPFSIDQGNIELVSSGNDWKIFHIFTGNDHYDIRSITVKVST